MLPHEAYNWINVAFFTLSPVGALMGVGCYAYSQGLHPGDWASFWFMLCGTGLAVNAGYHHYYSHRSYECHRAVQVFYLLFGAAAIQNSALIWASNHRSHHRFVDREGDPYNIRRGFFWAHLGWTFYHNPLPAGRRFANVADLTADRLVMWQHRYYLPLSLGTGFLLPLLLGGVYGRPWGSVLWGGLLRMVLFHHITFLVNSAGHSLGSQPYSARDSSRDNWWLALLMFGGGYHNFHHTFPGDYRSGVAWYQWDPTKWWIWSLSLVGLTRRLSRTPARAVIRARRRMERLRAEGVSDSRSGERKEQCLPSL
jgi:stearoyl-CoA desaturase (delta-9 desaturase)